jgi:ATP-dependent DNA ligase
VVWPRSTLSAASAHGENAVMVAFDLIELDGDYLRRSPIEYRKRRLATLVVRMQKLLRKRISLARPSMSADDAPQQ